MPKDWISQDDGPPPEFPADLSAVSFPTDQLTVADMRKDQPDILNSHRALIDSRADDVYVLSTLRSEVMLAKKAWAKAIGAPEPWAVLPRRDLVTDLNHMYMRYGLSTGRKQTEELVRRFEAEATRLAKLSIGEGRG